MNEPCQRLLRHLDQTFRAGPLEPDLEAHAGQCEECRRRLAIERTLRDDLATAPPLDASRRAALLERITSATAVAVRPEKSLRWPYAVMAAAAAVVLAVLVSWPSPRQPLPPTELFAALLGPLAESPSSLTVGESPAAHADDALPIGAVLDSLWGDLQAPVSIGLGAIEASRAVAACTPSAADVSSKSSNPGKEQ